jgi:metal-responsive CopG/Arc/MetJ family transcriptional regulator
MTVKKKSIRVYFTMDEEIYMEFEKYIEQNILDKSKLIEKLIIKYLEEIKK